LLEITEHLTEETANAIIMAARPHRFEGVDG
jgi:hypothetical protein